MGYNFRITRADVWTSSAMYPISLQEWMTVADAEPSMAKPGQFGRPGSYEYAYAEGRSACIDWRDGLITLNKGEATAELAGIAQKLGARLVGDEEEEYHFDGSRTEWAQPRPVLFHRALGVAEVEAAWRQTFDRLDDDYDTWRPSPHHAQHALATFRAVAAREVASADVPDADGLLYQYGPFAGGDGQRFRLSFVRQFATDGDGDGDGGLVQVECSLDYAMTEELACLGTFNQWWFPDDGDPRDQWLAALGGRPEWQVLNTRTPLTFGFSTDACC